VTHAIAQTGGGQIGLNYQIGWAVIGVEGAGSWADIRGDAPCGFFNFFACSTHSKSIVNVTGRIGALMMERTLVYVKGGVAWKDTDYSGHFTLIPGADVFNASSVRTGALFGAGAEYAFAQNWTAFIEYNYMDFRTKRLTYTAADGDTAIFDNNDKLHLVKAGLNYRFNWPFFHY
jgi:outer membrane immunogenic protein